MRKVTLFLAIFGIFAYAQEASINDWFNKKDISQGEELFSKNCAVCHGEEGVGPKDDWRKKLPNGKMKPPPLNGSAHTWHHKPELLLKIIATGGKSYGKGYEGWMPQFKDKLNKKERETILKYIHSLWPKKIQNGYDEFYKIK